MKYKSVISSGDEDYTANKFAAAYLAVVKYVGTERQDEFFADLNRLVGDGWAFYYVEKTDTWMFETDDLAMITYVKLMI